MMTAQPLLEAPLADAAPPASLEGASLEGAPLAALFAAARRGDERAADSVCRAMRPRLYRAAYALLRDADEADDVAQEALVRALTRRLLLMPRSVEGWMLRIAINLARNRGRDQRRRREILQDAAPHELTARGSLAASAPSALDSALEEERRARVEAAVEALPQRQRDVVKLRLQSQLSFEEIALALGIREDNARVTFSQAKRRLEQTLTGGTP